MTILLPSVRLAGPVAAVLLCLVALPFAGCASESAGRAEARAGSDSADDDALLRLLDEDLDAQAWHDPISATRRGDRRYDDRLPDLSPEGRLRWTQDARSRLAALDAIDRDALSPSVRTSADMLERELRTRLEADRFGEWMLLVSPLSGPHQDMPQWPDSISFNGREQLSAYAARLEAVPLYLDQAEACLREGVRTGLTPPRFVVERAADQALSQATAAHEADPTTHAMYRPFLGLAPSDPLAVRAQRAIRESVVPSMRGFGEFLRDEYVPGCRTTTGASEWPDGRAHYAWLLSMHTTTPMTADEIHRTGLSEVARIRAEMLDTIARSDFAGRSEPDADARFRAFLGYLRTDDRFYFDRPEELLAAYRDIAKRIDQHMPALFGLLPRNAYGVVEMPAFIAPSQTTAFYQPGSIENGVSGSFVANTYALDQRPKYEMIPLTLHEAVPGHHHQIALAQEMDGLPEWRTILWYTAFGEGWALYSERLGLEVGESPNPAAARPAPGSPDYRGMYQDPYDDFGRLTYEMWRAMRLVVDTGVHAKGWTRQQAIDFMLANSGLSRENIEREVDRYIAWPGQATAYKIGELRIRALRAEAEAALGDRFDRRAFHDVVLGSGCVPLDVLEANVRAWITEAR